MEGVDIGLQAISDMFGVPLQSSSNEISACHSVLDGKGLFVVFWCEQKSVIFSNGHHLADESN